MRKITLYPLIIFILVLIAHVAYSAWAIIQTSSMWVQSEDVSWPTQYLLSQDYMLGISYALASAFTVYSFLKIAESHKRGVMGTLGGITLTGILYFGVCFLTGCCGSPMLAVYLSLLGPSFLGFTKPLILASTAASIAASYYWMGKKAKNPCGCSAGDGCKTASVPASEGVGDIITIDKNAIEPNKIQIKNIRSELQEGIKHAKCQKCGCMKDALESLKTALSAHQAEGSQDLLKNIDLWLQQMEPVEYACLGCEYCTGATVMNLFNQAFPEAAQNQALSCAFEVRGSTWPPVPGDYFTLCNDQSCSVAVSTLASENLAERIASDKPKGLCIVGKTETENIGIDKVIKNIITNPSIRFLLLVGQDSQGHQSGRTLLALWEEGVDENMKVIDSPGKRPVLRNVTSEEVDAFRKQVKVIDMIGCEDAGEIVRKIESLSQNVRPTCGCKACTEKVKPLQISTTPVIRARPSKHSEMDKAGYFVIIPQPSRHVIAVEHYSYDDKLQRVIEGEDARSLYWTIIENDWITQLSHAAYLGMELAKAELSIKFEFKYIQD